MRGEADELQFLNKVESLRPARPLASPAYMRNNDAKTLIATG